MRRNLVFLILAAVALASDATAEILLTKRCRTIWQGQQVTGVMQIDRDHYYDTHRVYGQFRDQRNTLIEFEILTNQHQGVGGMWFNNARHRDVRIHWQMLPDGDFVITGEGGAAARYVCR